ncbi:MAG: hypothetical protein AAGM22_20200 [Acidobacteriota bacterium]
MTRHHDQGMPTGGSGNDDRSIREITILGIDTFDDAWNAVSYVGDLNGDGADDFALGAFGDNLIQSPP